MRRSKKNEDEPTEEPVLRDAEGDPVENPTLSGILPGIKAVQEDAAEVANELVAEAASAEAQAAPGAEIAPPEPVPGPAPVPPPEPEPGPSPPPPEPVPEPEPEPEPEPAPPEPEPLPTPGPAPEPPPPAAWEPVAPASPAGGRSELLIGAAFVGGLALAIILRRRLGR